MPALQWARLMLGDTSRQVQVQQTSSLPLLRSVSINDIIIRHLFISIRVGWLRMKMSDTDY